MAKVKHAKKIEALRDARRLIEDGTYSYICHALNGVSYESPRLSKACAKVKLHIQNVLEIGAGHGSSNTLESWQEERGIHRNAFERRQDRLLWIDWMIHEYSGIPGTFPVVSPLEKRNG